MVSNHCKHWLLNELGTVFIEQYSTFEAGVERTTSADMYK